MPVMGRARNGGRGSFLGEALEEKTAGRGEGQLPDVVNHRRLQDSEEPMLLGVLGSFLYFSPG